MSSETRGMARRSSSSSSLASPTAICLGVSVTSEIKYTHSICALIFSSQSCSSANNQSDVTFRRQSRRHKPAVCVGTELR